jgi:hypothetical protein
MTTIHYACVATEQKLYLPYLQRLLPELVILGLGTPWEGFITKYKLLRTYLQSLDANAIICFVDAYDLLPTKHITKLEQTFLTFEAAHPNIKMVVGYDYVDNAFHEYLSQQIFGIIENSHQRLNSGQFIGRVKHISAIINHILDHTTHFQTDQIELTKYANANPGEIYIDEDQQFFYVKSKPLQQVTCDSSKTYAFVHANGNGFLETFLYKEHGIQVSPRDKYKFWLDNLLGLIRKIILYDIIYVKKYVKKINVFLETLYKQWFAQLLVLFQRSSLSE